MSGHPEAVQECVPTEGQAEALCPPPEAAKKWLEDYRSTDEIAHQSAIRAGSDWLQSKVQSLSEHLEAFLEFDQDLANDAFAACANLEVPKGLRISWFESETEKPGLLKFPVGLQVKGDLFLTNCGFENLPEGLTVEGNLWLWSCKHWSSFPSGMMVGRGLFSGGNLSLQDCEQWDGSIPADASVFGKIEVEDHHFTVPRGGVTADELRWMNALEKKCTHFLQAWQGGELEAAHACMDSLLSELETETWLVGVSGRGLGLAIRILVGLSPEFAKAVLETIDIVHWVVGDVDLSNCRGLTHFPGGMNIHGDLDLSNCGDLVAIELGMVIDGDLSLSHCDKLETLPKRLEVGRCLDLTGCSSLETLPESMSVATASNFSPLSLHHCFRWNGLLPKQMKMPLSFISPEGKLKHTRNVRWQHFRATIGTWLRASRLYRFARSLRIAAITWKHARDYCRLLDTWMQTHPELSDSRALNDLILECGGWSGGLAEVRGGLFHLLMYHILWETKEFKFKDTDLSGRDFALMEKAAGMEIARHFPKKLKAWREGRP